MRLREPTTDDIELASLEDSGLTQTYEAAREQGVPGLDQRGIEANIILIAHPDGQRLGTRFRLTPGSVLEIGRSPTVDVSLPEVLSLSRRHACLRHLGASVVVEDLESTNGTYVNGELIRGAAQLASGDRFQVATVHFKFLHEQDVEHAYYEAIYDLVTRDGLTDIFNKRKYDEEAVREFARCTRHQRPLSLILLDLDDFKEVNDTHGHLCGDFVLKEFTSIVRPMLRPEQIFARVGGDEFVILAPETGGEGASALAEKIRRDLERSSITYNEREVGVTCSCGVAELTPAIDSLDALYEAADQALYLSKERGRNRVSLRSAAGGGG